MLVRADIRLGAAGLALAGLLLSAACLAHSSPPLQSSDALNRGLAAQKAGRLDEAAADYRQAIASDPKNKYAYYDLGVVNQAQNQPSQAENNYRAALSIDPNFAPALFNLGYIRSHAGAYNEAIDLYRRDIALDPNNSGAHLNLGLVLRLTGQEAAAQAELQKATQLNPQLKIPPPPTAASGT